MRSVKTRFRLMLSHFTVLGLAGALVLAFIPATTRGADPVEDGLRVNVLNLIRLMDRLGCALPEQVVRELSAPLPNEAAEEEFVRRAQRVLDPLCLVEIAINPESRVKAARGPGEATLMQGKLKCFVLKVRNEAGVTQALTVTGPQVRFPTEQAENRWLEADIRHVVLDRLTGREVEYVLLRLRTEHSGKREATLTFDVGQGTQDLGFRAEVPILFTIRPRSGDKLPAPTSPMGRRPR
jgi:hypothetical protein